ncbi:MAG: hypothetical protein BGO49_04115 [Planctomycetales bacterium 71-10]|nr:MAG: hypothetical protein BGO49_04115 [Planctomycetales bacterium 71-10]
MRSPLPSFDASDEDGSAPALGSSPLPPGEGTIAPPSSIDDCDGAIVEPEPAPAWTFPTGPFVADTNVFGFGSGPVEFEDPRPRRAMARAAEEDPAGFDPSRTRRSKGDEGWILPSVQDVLNSGLRRARAEAGAIPRPPSRPAPATPTEAVAPAQWSLPAWLATPPALAATLAAGGLLAACSWRQATVSHAAAAVIQAAADVRLAGAAAKDRPLPPGLVPPAASWWGAAPAHLAEWGVYLDGTKVEHGWDATAAGMFEAASAVGPLDPLARFALARKRGDAAPAAGLSRDAAALAWTGRTLHRAGKDAEAVRAYRRALEVAAKAEPPRDAPLAYSPDPNVPRYLLPGEDLAAAVVADLAADASWPYRDWAEAVPESGVSALAAARALRKDGRPEADAILRRIVERAEADARARAGGPDEPDPDEEAVALAVAAEAMAMRADWKAAAGRYRAAIDRMADARVRRSWWFNLADVAAHANDDDQRRAALDEALASASSDEVSRRVLELRQGSAGQLRPKAN